MAEETLSVSGVLLTKVFDRRGVAVAALPGGEPAARPAPGAPADGRPGVLRARLAVLLDRARARLPRRRHARTCRRGRSSRSRRCRSGCCSRSASCSRPPSTCRRRSRSSSGSSSTSTSSTTSSTGPARAPSRRRTCAAASRCATSGSATRSPPSRTAGAPATARLATRRRGRWPGSRSRSSRAAGGDRRAERRRQDDDSYLIPRLYEPNRGTVALDGVDVQDLTLGTLAGRDRDGHAGDVPLPCDGAGEPALRAARCDAGADRGGDEGRADPRADRRAVGRLRHGRRRARLPACPAARSSVWRSRG